MQKNTQVVWGKPPGATPFSYRFFLFFSFLFFSTIGEHAKKPVVDRGLDKYSKVRAIVMSRGSTMYVGGLQQRVS